MTSGVFGGSGPSGAPSFRRRRRIGVLADDLTGAGDAALAFEAAGFKTEIALWPPRRNGPRDAAVWIMSTESRPLSPAAARRRVRRGLEALKRWKAGFVFKKIDSTLRGPVKVEASAFARILRVSRSEVWVVPAFPSAGRTVEKGVLLVRGVPLHKTAFGRDPRHPLRTGSVEDLVGKGFRVPDVADESDLRRAARAMVREGGWAAAGSAGFAGALARELAGSARAKRVPRFSLPGGRTSSSDVLLVSGSAHPLSRIQKRRVEASRRRGAAPLLPAIVSSPEKRGDPKTVLRAVVREALRAIRSEGFRRLAVTGGETAAALARGLGVGRFRVVGAVDRGVPLMRSPENQFWWVTKPGGFGREDVWTKAIALLSRVPNGPG